MYRLRCSGIFFQSVGNGTGSTGGSLAMILGTDVRLESPNPTPFIYQAKWKTWPIHILPISKIDPIHILFLKIDPIHILFFKFYPFIYFLGEKDTPLIYFWCKNDTHSYTGRPEKYTPFQPHICIYLYNGSYPPVTGSLAIWKIAELWYDLGKIQKSMSLIN